MSSDSGPPREPVKAAGRRQAIKLLLVGAAALGGLWLVGTLINAVFAKITGTYEQFVRLPPVSDQSFWSYYAVYSGVIAVAVGLIGMAARRLRLAFNLLLWAIAAILIPLILLSLPVSHPSADQYASGDVDCGSFRGWKDSPDPPDKDCVDALEARSRWALTLGAVGLIAPIAWMYTEVRREERLHRNDSPEAHS